MTRKLLVVGASGFIGQHLVHALIEAGMHVTAQMHRARAEFDPRVNVVSTDSDVAALLRGCDTIVWLACGTTPASSASSPALELEYNLAPLLGLLQALQEQPEHRLVFVSSGGTLYGDVDHAASESLPAHPRSYYAAGKAAAEHFIEAYCLQHGGTATILRPSNVYGPGQTLHGGFGVIPAAMECLQRNKAMTIWGDGETLRDYLYIRDFIAACLAVISAPQPRGIEAFNVCSGKPTSLNKLLEALEQVAGHKLQRNYQPRRAVDLQNVLLDGTKIRRRLGWMPNVSLHDGLRQTWRWFTTPHP